MPMSPERWQVVKTLCQRALDCDPEDREAFLAAACLSDPDLRHEVDALLAHATEGEGILDIPVWRELGVGPASTEASYRAPASRQMPDTIGRYRIRRLIGEGGM